YEIGDTGDLLRHVVWFMTSQLVTFEPPDFPGLEFLTWQRIDLEKQRNPYLKMVLEQKNLRQGEIQTSIFICTMLFMSTDGNKHEKLYFPFLEYMEYTVLKKKYSLTTDANTYRPWLNTRTLAAQLLGKIIQWTLDYGRADKTGQLRLDEYTYGDILNGIIKCWNLAHLHVNVIDTIADILSLLPVNDPILDAQFQIMRRYNEKMSMESISLFVKAAYFYSKLFYGIRNIGYTHTRVWMTRTTYQGLIAAFNKSNTGDNECNFIFGPVNKRERWVDLAQIDLPPLNNVTDMTGRELGLVVVLVANRRQDESVTPTLIIYMTNSSNSYPRLPGSAEYSITLPILLGGIPANLSDKLQLTLSSLLRPSNYADRYKHFTVFKVVLPNDFEIWDLQIVMIERTPLKVKINLHQLPDYDDVANVTPSKPKYSRVLDYYVIAHVVKPEPPSLTIPRYFYVGLLLADSVPEEIKFTIGVRDTVNICWLQDIDMKSGEKTCKGKQLGLSLTVECVCDEFGIIIGRATPVRFATIMMNQINGTYDETITISQFSVPFILLAICVGLILVMIYADMQRQKKDILVRMQDTHIWDTYPIVIGVYTKSNFLSGTISSVAIKIEGRNSSSRVHLLKHKSRKLLNRGNDDWFLFTTNQPLGRIQHVYLWHNYHCLSDWYCDYILIYDIYQGNWYMAEVNRWFRLHPNMDDSRFAQIRTVKFNNVETGLKAMPGKIKCHILNELRNSHYVHSLRKLHLRSLYTFENRILAFQTKLIGLIFGSFFVQALQLFNVGDYYGTVVPSSEDIHFTRDTVWIIIIVDVISYAFAFPYILIIRSRFMSGFIQKKTTNPINVEVIRKEKKDAFAPYKKVKKLKAEQPKEKETKMESKGRYVLFAEGSTLMQESEKERERNWEEYQAQKQPTTLWLATLLRQSWAKKALILVFGPTQFRCINAPGQIFDLKNKRRIVYARLYAGFVLLVGFSAIFFILEFTNFGAKYNVTIFYLILVLVYDTFLLNPIIIILHAFVIFMVLQTSSREYHFWSASNELELPKPLDFVDYFYTAIKPAYKPLPSSEIEKIKKVSRMSNRMKMFFLYLYTMLCIVFLVRILNTRYDVGYYFSVRAIRAITEDRKLSVGIRGKGKVQTSIRQVLEPESAQEFVTSVFGELKYQWPNKKRMGFTSRQDRWFLDRESKIIGPASVLVTRTPTKNQLKMPKYFTDIFSDAFGFISESGVEEMPVTLSGIHMNHTSLHPSVTVQGKSGTNYYLVGNQAIIPTIEWKAYYYNLATLFEDLSTRKDVVPRLIVISYKILTANTFRLTLIDLIVEYMPSGECSAVLNIASIKVTSDDVTTSVISRSLLLVLVTVHVIIAVAGVSTMGFIEYSTHSYGMVKVILSASGILMVFTTFVCYFPQHVVLDKLFKLPADVFLDLHDIDAKFALDSTALSLFLFVMCLDLAVAVKDALSLKIITAVFAKGFRTILAIMLILIIYTKAASLSANMNYSFLIPVFFKVLLPLDPGITEERFFITIAIISVMKLALVVWLAVTFYEVEGATSKCACGYGNLCVTIGPAYDCKHPEQMHNCKAINKETFYDSTNCNKIINHCDGPNPCSLGTCVPTFGSFFCDCPPGWFGQYCDINDPLLESEDMKNPLYIYHQVQTGDKGKTLPFYLIFDPGPQFGIMKKYETAVKIEVELFDGARYYPTRNKQFERLNVKEICHEDVKSDPLLYDIHVCTLLPEGVHWVFKFDPRVYYPNFRNPIRTKINYKRKYVGNVIDVVIAVEYYNRGEKIYTLYKNRYPVLTYENYHVKTFCKRHVLFHGCGERRYASVVQLRGSVVKIKVSVAKTLSCNGTRNIGIKWWLQRGIAGFNGEYDPVPKELDFGDSKSITFPSRFFSDTEYMIEAVVTVMGDPPHYGGTTVHTAPGRCFLKIETGPMIVIPKGGDNVSVPCHFNLEIDLVSLNKGMPISEMQFVIKCRQLYPPSTIVDRECQPRSTEVPKIRKIETPCNAIYEYTVTITHFISRPITKDLVVVVHFVPNHVRLTLQCLYNCFPVDYKYMLVMVATTEPYVPASIQWSVTVNGEPLVDNYIEAAAAAFLPLSTTRILRIDGKHLNVEDRTLTDVTITATVKESPQLSATVHTVTNALTYELAKFDLLQSVDPRGTVSVKYVNVSEVNFAFQPIKYQIMEYQDSVSSYLLYSTIYNIYELKGEPFFRQVLLCVQDAVQMRECSKPEELKGYNNKQTNLKYVLFLFSIGDDSEFLFKVAIHFNLQLGNVEYEGRQFLTWTTTDLDGDQLQLINLMEKLKYIDLVDTEIRSVLFILTMTFFSKPGNEAEKLTEFVDPLEYLADGHGGEIPESYFRAWMKIRISALANLYKVIKWTLDSTYGRTQLTNSVDKEDLLAGIVRCWNMAYLQSILIQDLANYLKINGNITEVVEGQFKIVAVNNDNLLKIAMGLFVKTTFRFAKLYYDVNSYGMECTRVWVIRSTYQGILKSFNYSAEPDDKVMFRPIISEQWLKEIRLYLPDLDKVISLNGLDLQIVVVVVTNRRHDTTISPTLLVHLSSLRKAYQELPGKVDYGIQLPIVIEGNRVNLSSAKVFSDSIQRPIDDIEKLTFYTVYKVIFPNEFEVWNLRIFTDTATAMKVMVNLHSVPDYHETYGETPVEVIYKEDLKAYVSEVVVKPELNSEILPRNIYIGILLTNTTPRGVPIRIKIRNTVDVCWLQDIELKAKETTCKGKQLGGLLIDCTCNTFGLIQARATPIRITKIPMTPIVLVVEDSILIVQLIIPIVVTALVFIMIVAAIIVDFRRKRLVVLIPMEDVWPSDRYPLIIGVFTSSNLMASTRSTVAIKIEGRASSSRVHLLKCSSRRVLKRAEDDWFVLATNQPLGKIHHIYLWHNYHYLSNWRCRYIMIFDIKQEFWYIANVNRWFKLQPTVDDSRFAQIRTYRIANMETGLKAMPGKLKDHLLCEIHNSHYFISMFMVHLRSMYSHESRVLAYLIKLIAIFFGCWFIQEVHLFHDEHDENIAEPTLEDIHFDFDSVKIIIIIDIFSYLFVAPYIYIIRSSFMSGLIQRKTTNPLNIDVIRMEQSTIVEDEKGRKSTKLSSGKSFAGRSSSGKSFVGKSFASKHSKGTKSVLFQDSYDATDIEQSWTVQETPKTAQKTWAVTHMEHSRTRKILTLLFGPCQLRCINVTNEIFDVKMFRKILFSRFVAALTILCGLGAIFYVLQFTNVGAKYYVTLFYVVLVIVFDICILNLILILLKTLVMFQVLQVSNREFNFWSESHKLEMPTPLSLWEYFYTATEPEYKPKLSSEIEKLKKKSILYRSITLSISYLYVTLCLIFTAYILGKRFDGTYHFFIRTATAMTDSGRLSNDIRKGPVIISASDVNRPEKVAEFIQATFGELVYTWPNKKRIDTMTGDRRFFDGVSKVFGPASILISRIAPKKRQKKVAKYFTEHYDEAYGFLAESDIDKTPILLAGNELNYTKMTTSILRGKSGSKYAMEGNQVILPLFPNWKSYYVTLVTMMEDLSRKEDQLTRLIVISVNVVTCNTHRLSVVDLVIEFLPSGECSVRLHIDSLKVRSYQEQNAFLIMRTVIMLLALVHIAFAVVDISTMGFNNFISHWYGRTKVALGISAILLCLSTLINYYPKNLAIDTFFKIPADTYMDLHTIHQKYWQDSLALTLFLLIMCVDLAVAIKDNLKPETISAMSTRGFHLLVSMFLIIMIYSRAAASSANVLSNGFDFVVLFFNRGIFPLIGGAGQNQFFVIVAIIITCVNSKFCLAIFIYDLEASDKYFVSEYHPGRSAIHRSKVQPLRSTRGVKTRFLQKYGVRTASSRNQEDIETTKSFTTQKSGSPLKQEDIETKKSLTSRQSGASSKKESHIRIQEEPEHRGEQRSSEEDDGTKKLDARTSRLSSKVRWNE
ncbi:hypothetical protein GE061_015385, partial [Apolygus lucorum]